MNHKDYCSYCKRRTEHIVNPHDYTFKICKTCGRQERSINPLNLLIR